MKSRELRISGAFEFTPESHRDHRGWLATPYHHDAFVAAAGQPLFEVRQTIHSESRLGVVRGIHFTTTPPGSAKYVYCARGKVTDFVVDIRTGSPTFGEWDAVELSGESCRAVYLPVGVGHAFAVLEEGSAMCYMLSAVYDLSVEHSLSVLDPAIGLPLSQGPEPVLSGRDLTAPTLSQALELDLLPRYADCVPLTTKSSITR